MLIYLDMCSIHRPLDDKTQLPQVILVSLEHAIESVTRGHLAVRLNRAPQLMLTERTAGVHQAQLEAKQWKRTQRRLRESRYRAARGRKAS